MQQIITMGGGGFMMEPDNLALDRYILEQTQKDTPKICFLGQASAEHHTVIVNFYQAFLSLNSHPSHLSLFQPHTADIEDYLMAQDVIYVGGGNTKSMLALWREWELDRILQQAAENGTVLAGISAGCICWFENGTTDSIPGGLRVLSCLGYLKGGCSPHYDGEAQRRPMLHQFVESGQMNAAYAFDDGAAGHFLDGELKTVVSSRPHAKGYFVEKVEGEVIEKEIVTRYLPG